MNWGYKIIAVYAVFVAGMLFLAYQSFRQNIELVTEDYYAKELVYQQRIDQTKRAGLLSAPVNITVASQELSIIFPKDFISKKITGDVTLYCPFDKKKDIQQQFIATNNAVKIILSKSYQGLLYVKVYWDAEGISYYYEKKIII